MEAYSLLMLALAVAGAIVWDLLARGAADRKARKIRLAEEEEAEAAAAGLRPPARPGGAIGRGHRPASRR